MRGRSGPDEGTDDLAERRASLIVVLILAELAGLAFAYQFLVDFECRRTGAEQGCFLLRSLVVRGIAAVLALGLFVWARRLIRLEGDRGLALATAAAGPADGRPAPPAFEERPLPAAPRAAHRWMLLHLSGVALLFYPLAMAPLTDSGSFFGRALVFWAAGSLPAAAGALLWLAPLRAWGDWLAGEGYWPLPVMGVAALVPELTRLVLPLWDVQALAAFTFDAVRTLLSAAGLETYSDPLHHVIGLEGFYVEIGQPCSGLEGFVLVTGFVALYGFLFRRDLRLLRYWSVVLPLGLALSWMFNVLRIAAMIVLGARVSPEIAVNGFHSYAGWMFFTLLALLLILLVHATGAFHAARRPAAGPSLRDDRLAASILPLSVFLLAGSIGSALAPHPEMAFPFRALAAVGALWFFRRHYRGLELSRDPVALVAGAAVGALWVATEPAAPDQAAPLAMALLGLDAVALALWVTVRLLGGALLVPLVEELFFRGYLLGRLDFGGRFGRSLAVVLSSALFAVLHERWLEAWAAGVVFALVMLRRNRLGDAILAHVAANGLIAGWAILQGDWAGV